MYKHQSTRMAEDALNDSVANSLNTDVTIDRIRPHLYREVARAIRETCKHEFENTCTDCSRSSSMVENLADRLDYLVYTESLDN